MCKQKNILKPAWTFGALKDHSNAYSASQRFNTERFFPTSEKT